MRGHVLISVMMAVYNDVSLLPMAIESVRAQSYGDWELLIMDNSDSNPQAWEMLTEYRKSDERIRIFRSPGHEGHINVGWPKASSLLLKEVRGDYVFFLAADDSLDEDAFLWVSEEAERHDPDVVWVGNAYMNYEGGEVNLLDTAVAEYRYFTVAQRQEAVQYILANVYYNTMFHFCRVSFLREHHIDFFDPYYSDCAAMTAVLCMAERMVVLDRIVYYLTVNTSQTAGRVTTTFYRMFAMQWRLLREVYEDGDERKRFAAARVLRNFNSNLTNLISGAACRDEYMNPIEADETERLRIAGEAMNDSMIMEMSEM